MFFLLSLLCNFSFGHASLPLGNFCERHAAATNCPETDWIEAAKQSYCEQNSLAIQPPAMIIFYFDGAAYFSPKDAKEKLNAVNLNGNEAQEPFRYAVNAWSSLWRPAFEKESKLKWDTSVEFHYQSGDGAELFHGAKDGLACFNSISEDIQDLSAADATFRKPKLVLMGHSNGGAAAIGVATKTSYPVDLVLLVDPVPLAPGYIEEKISNEEEEFWASGIPSNVARVADIYQQTDTGTLAGIFSIRGSEVAGANRLENLVMPPDPQFEHRKDHIRILQAPETVLLVSEELAKLTGK